MKLVLLVVFLLCSYSCIASNESLNETVNESTELNLSIVPPNISITEIMFNPVGEDSGNEFVEFRFNGTINYSQLIIGDYYANDTLLLVKNGSGEFAVIVDEYSDVGRYNCTVLRTDGLIGNGLGNSGDGIKIWHNEILIDSVSYQNGVEGMSLQGNPWQSAVPTPCASQALVVEINYTNSTNETEEHIDNLCPSGLRIEVAKFVYESGEAIKFMPLFAEGQGAITYWVETYSGKTVKSPITSNRITERRYTPKSATGIELYIIKAESEECSLQQASEYVAVVGETEEEDESEPNLELEVEYESKNLCETKKLNMEMKLARGASQKSVVQVKAYQNGKSIGETTKFTLGSKKSDVKILFPMSIGRLDCELGRLTVTASGLGFEEERVISFEIPEPDPLPKPEIISAGIDRVYTLAKKFKGESITMRVKMEPDSHETLIFVAPADAFMTAPVSSGETAELRVTPNQADQLYYVWAGSEMTEFRLNLTEELKEVTPEEVHIKVPVMESNISLMSITGSAVATQVSTDYLSASAKASKYSPYALSGLLAVIGGVWLYRR